MTSKNRILLTLAIAFAGGCHDSGSEDITERAVVESYLRPGKRIEVNLSKEGLFVDSTLDTLAFIDGLAIAITDGENSYLLQSVGEGNYLSGDDELVAADKIYSLEFEYGGKELSASTYVPLLPEGFELSAHEIEVERPDPGSGSPPALADPIDVTWENPQGDYHLVVVTVIEEDPEKIFDDGGGIVRVGGSFRNEPNTGTTYRITPFSFEYYGMHAVVLYRLNPEYATLYEDAGNSSLNLKSPYSNITNGLGIFTGVNSDTLYLNVKKP